jgi:hypothetical protein
MRTAQDRDNWNELLGSINLLTRRESVRLLKVGSTSILLVTQLDYLASKYIFNQNDI